MQSSWFVLFVGQYVLTLLFVHPPSMQHFNNIFYTTSWLLADVFSTESQQNSKTQQNFELKEKAYDSYEIFIYLWSTLTFVKLRLITGHFQWHHVDCTSNLAWHYFPETIKYTTVWMSCMTEMSHTKLVNDYMTCWFNIIVSSIIGIMFF